MAFILLANLLPGIVATSSGQQFQAKGLITHTLHTHTNRVAKSDFEVWVDDCKWFIKSRPHGEGPFLVSYEAGSDGVDSYVLHRLGAQPLAQSPRARMLPPESLPSNVANGMVYPGTVPGDTGMSMIPPVWLAYASACYLDRQRGNRLAPVWVDARLSLNTDTFLPAAWERNSSPPKLPTFISYLNEGTNYDIRSEDSKLISSPWPPPFDHGYTNVIYSAGKMTNMAGKVTIPLEFSLRVFIPKIRASNDQDVTLWVSYEGVLLEASPQCSRQSFLPDVPTNTPIDDRRFARSKLPVNCIGYTLTNGHWLKRNDPWLRRQYEIHSRAQANLHPERSTFAKYGYFVVLSLMCILTFVFVYAGRPRRTSE